MINGKPELTHHTMWSGLIQASCYSSLTWLASILGPVSAVSRPRADTNSRLAKARIGSIGIFFSTTGAGAVLGRALAGLSLTRVHQTSTIQKWPIFKHTFHFFDQRLGLTWSQQGQSQGEHLTLQHWHHPQFSPYHHHWLHQLECNDLYHPPFHTLRSWPL